MLKCTEELRIWRGGTWFEPTAHAFPYVNASVISDSKFGGWPVSPKKRSI